METEIELKYLVVNERVVEQITQLLDEKNYQYTIENKTLTNSYFDTQLLSFRQHDFGLRVRRCGEHREQTIKTAGTTVGGLHQRPEYNVNINDNIPNLTLFPDDIWPENIDLSDWQKNLVVLFSTDFTRYLWTITCEDKSVVELAFDEGVISSLEQKTPICEIELELLSGNVSSLFSLARQLSDVLLIRPGIRSKAARGYQLWHQQSGLFDLKTINFLPISVEKNIAENFVTGLSFALTRLQQIISNYFEKPSLTLLNDFHRSLFLLRHGFWVYEELITEELVFIRKELTHFIRMFAWVNNACNLQDLMMAQSCYRKKIEYSQQLVTELKLKERRYPDIEQVFKLIQSSRFNHLQISLLSFIVSYQSNTDTNTDVYTFAKQCLAKSAQSQVDNMLNKADLSAEQFLSLKQLLNRRIQTNRWLGGLFDEKLRADDYVPWLDIMHGITELETLTMLSQQLNELNEQPAKLLGWLEQKIDNLVAALNASRQRALSAREYWHI